MVDQIKEKFTGKWKLDRSEQFDEFLSAIGVNVVMRKTASLAKPEVRIQVKDDGTIGIVTSSTFNTNEDHFTLNQEFEQVNQFSRKKFKNMPTFENGKLRITSTPVDESFDGPYPECIEREITDSGELLLTIKMKDVICKRWFKKLD